MGPRQVSEGQMTPSLFLSKKATCFCSGVICISSSPSLPTETKTLICETSVVAREESNLLPEEEDEEIIVFGWARRLRKWRRQVWLRSNVPQYRVRENTKRVRHLAKTIFVAFECSLLDDGEKASVSVTSRRMPKDFSRICYWNGVRCVRRFLRGAHLLYVAASPTMWLLSNDSKYHYMNIIKYIFISK